MPGPQTPPIAPLLSLSPEMQIIAKGIKGKILTCDRALEDVLSSYLAKRLWECFEEVKEGKVEFELLEYRPSYDAFWDYIMSFVMIPNLIIGADGPRCSSDEILDYHSDIQETLQELCDPLFEKAWPSFRTALSSFGRA